MTVLRCIGIACEAAALAAAQPVFNPLDYGAKADGRTNDTASIQKAIDACNRAGGGTVLFPNGNFLTGTIVLKSNVTLSPGATLWGSRRIEDYSPVHLMYAEGAENIAIEGQGVNGNGDAFWEPDFRAKPKRPMQLIELIGCRNVHIRDIRIRNAPPGASTPGTAMASTSAASP
jgi:polygalacturonase